MKIRREDFNKYIKDLSYLTKAKTEYLQSYAKDPLSATNIYSQPLYKSALVKTYNKYKVYENGIFEDIGFKIDYLSDYIFLYLDYIKILGYERGLKNDEGFNVYFLDKSVSYKNSFIDEYEKMLLDVIRLANHGIQILKDTSITNKLDSFVSKIGLCNYELGELNTFYKDVYKGIEYYKEAYNSGILSAAGLLVYIFTRDDYQDFDAAIEYYQKLKDCPIVLEDIRLMQYYYQSTVHLALMYEKLGQYKETLMLLDEFGKKCKIRIPDINADKNHVSSLYTEIYLRVQDKLKEVEECKTKTDLIRQHFSEGVLQKMSNQVKIYTETSLKVYEYLESLNNDGIILDYSAATMPIMKAVEHLLKIIVKKYLEHLNKCFKESKISTNDFSQIDKYLLNNERTQLKEKLVDHLEIGSAYYILFKRKKLNGQNNSVSEPRGTFLKFCKTLNIEDVQNKVNSVGEILFKVKDYRNNSAHDVRIVKSYADECLNIIIYDYINLINELYAVFGSLFV